VIRLVDRPQPRPSTSQYTLASTYPITTLTAIGDTVEACEAVSPFGNSLKVEGARWGASGNPIPKVIDVPP
jgi:hypothetical protein